MLRPTVKEVVEDSDVIVLGKKEEGFAEALAPYLGDKLVFDLVRLSAETPAGQGTYDGVCW